MRQLPDDGQANDRHGCKPVYGTRYPTAVCLSLAIVHYPDLELLNDLCKQLVLRVSFTKWTYILGYNMDLDRANLSHLLGWPRSMRNIIA